MAGKLKALSAEELEFACGEFRSWELGDRRFARRGYTDTGTRGKR